MDGITKGTKNSVGGNMLLKITNRCYMECSHCAEESNIDGEHMDKETLTKVIQYLEKLKPSIALISGGEPTEHPDILEIIQTLQYLFDKRVILTSNGMFLSNFNLREKILGTGIKVQITNDKRYYPKQIEHIEHKNLVYEHEIRKVSPIGRAKESGIDCNGKMPLCFNIRSVARSLRESMGKGLKLHDIIYYMEFKLLKFCIPQISVKGEIKMGEFRGCNVIGNLDSTDEEIINNLVNARCNKCGMFNNLTEEYRKVVGEI